MKKICLTIDIDVNDECFDDFLNFEKINIGDIIMGEKISLEPFELEEVRGKIVAKRIRKVEKNLLIGFAIKNRNDLKIVLELSERKKEYIFKVYFDNDKRKNATIEKYKKDYSLHSRWLDYSPEYVENSYKEFDNEVEKIKVYAIENKIEIISI